MISKLGLSNEFEPQNEGRKRCPGPFDPTVRSDRSSGERMVFRQSIWLHPS